MKYPKYIRVVQDNKSMIFTFAWNYNISGVIYATYVNLKERKSINIGPDLKIKSPDYFTATMSEFIPEERCETCVFHQNYRCVLKDGFHYTEDSDMCDILDKNNVPKWICKQTI